MFKMMNKLKNRKGFTLIELIVVLAVLAIIAAIAIPRFATIQDQSKIKADAATAQQIVNAARIMEVNKNDGSGVTGSTSAAGWDAKIMDYPTPQSGTSFVLEDGFDKPYKVKWQPATSSNKTVQTVTEGEAFTLKP